jgi:hypothetical protein
MYKTKPSTIASRAWDSGPDPRRYAWELFVGVELYEEEFIST